MATLALFMLVAMATTFDMVNGGSLNGVHENFSFECPSSSIVSRLKAVNLGGDQKWTIECRSGYTVSDCQWTGWSSYDKSFDQECPRYLVLAGLKSEVNSYQDDRRYSLRCCQTNLKYTAFSCKQTEFLNTGSSDMDYKLPEGELISEIYGHHFVGAAARRFKITHCPTN